MVQTSTKFMAQTNTMQPRVKTKSIGDGALIWDLTEPAENWQNRLEENTGKSVFRGKETYTVGVCMQFRRALANRTQSNLGRYGENNIFIQESLTEAKRKLFKNCLKFRKE